MISINDFKNVKLKVAKILEAEPVEGTDKLMKLKIKVGEDIRQLVAGIALHYKPEDLIGKKIIIVVNLQPAKIRGIESKGMLLAAVDKKTNRMSLVTIDDPDIPTGTMIS